MFQPVIPAEGLAGWRFLQRTYEAQLATYAAAPRVARDSDYFLQRIGSITTAEELVADRRLLTVALGAFGLQEDINNRYFIRKVLEEGVASADALANRLSNKRYREMAEAFGLGAGSVPRTAQEAFAARIVARFEARGFEVAAGEVNSAMRVALHARDALPQLAADGRSLNARWYTILGDPPLRQLFEKALGLPSSIGQIDIDRQLTVFKDRAERVLGSDGIDRFTDPAAVENVITRFILRDQMTGLQGNMSSGAVALALLQRA